LKLSAFFKPEYLFNVSQIPRRLALGVFPPRGGQRIARTPWGWELEVHTDDDMGKSLIYLGVYDLVVSETIWRLVDEGEVALDIGANVGYMTALLARRVGPKGMVLCFEAHPELARELRANVGRWKRSTGEEVIRVYEQAVSDREGTVCLAVPAQFTTNRGLSHVLAAGGSQESGGHSLSVPSGTLDQALVDVGPVGLAKMDVEGHEEAVLRGASQVLEAHRVRDWVFEHHPAYPSPVTGAFEQHGYTVFQIQKRFFGPALLPASTPVVRSVWEPPNYLATLDPNRALDRMRGRGWKVLRSVNSAGATVPPG
jgi:FkbM family methyltransferase